jgi:uncharacterized protein DUF551
MSTETCKICEKECTPWFHINGHICFDCYHSAREESLNKEDKSMRNDFEICKHQWISVDERLPDKNEKVIFTDKENVYVGSILLQSENHRLWVSERELFIFDKYEDKIDKITHWMPLPLPPK